MQSLDKLAFYTLVKAGLGSKVQPMPAEYNWDIVLQHICMHGMTGIACDGLVAIYNKYGGENIPINFMLALFGYTHSVTINTTRLWNICADFAKKMQPLRCYVLKGMDYAKFWPNPKYREFGDVDIVVTNDSNEIIFDEGNKKAMSFGAHLERGTYKHSHIHYNGIVFENHKFITNIEGTKHGKEMEFKLRKLMCLQAPTFLYNTTIYSPSVNFTAIFMLKHTQHHFVFEGIALRHFIDWMYFVEKEGKNIDWDWFYSTLDEMKLRKFTDMLNAFCERKLGWIKKNEHITCNATDKLLNDVEEYLFTPKANVQNRNLWYIIRRFYQRFKRMWKFRDLHYQNFLVALWTSIAYADYFDRSPEL